MSDTAIARLLEYWNAEPGLGVRRGVVRDSAEQFKNRFGVTLPKEVSHLYEIVDGFEPPNDQDRNGFSFWPLKRIVSVKEFYSAEPFEGASNTFIFADYLGWSWAYAFRVTADDAPAPVCIVGTANSQPVWIADSFTEFLELYLADSPRLYVGGALA